MQKRDYIIAGNWKMNGTKESVRTLLDQIKKGVARSTAKQCRWIVFPPYVFLDEVEHELRDTKIAWGAQNLNIHEKGAHTGEISASMLKEFDCCYVLVGHSERRTLYGENDELVAEKFLTAYKADLIPILCVGETLEQRQQELSKEVVNRQLLTVIKAANGIDLFKKAIIAYEPVWAIGTGVNATPEQAQEIHHEIRQKFAAHDPDLAEKLHILYGGSLKPSNAKALLQMPDIDGGLIGGASLKAEDFLNIGALCNL